MGYTVQQFRSLLRDQLDTDSEDISDSLIDAWLREGWRYCVHRRRRWPFLRGTWKLAVAGGLNVYPLTAFTQSTPSGAVPLEVDAVFDADGRPLRWVGFEQAQNTFSRNPSGTPRYWSADPVNLFLYPVPQASTTVQLWGWREPTLWPAGEGSTTQIPSEFDDVILNWSIGRAFQRQEEGDLGVMHLDQAEVLLKQLERRFGKHAASAPMILSDGVPPPAERPVAWNV